MSQIVEVVVPDIGEFADVEIIEVIVKVGDSLDAEAALITLESDKAAMEIPTPQAGTVKEILVKEGERVSAGSPILKLEISTETAKSVPSVAEAELPIAKSESEVPSQTVTTPVPTAENHSSEPRLPFAPDTDAGSRRVHASPSIRRFARELGVPLGSVRGSGVKGRISKEDIQKYVKQALIQPQQGGSGTGIPALPQIDFSPFGEIRPEPLSRIKKISGKHLHACWLNIPHVTQFDEADITELEAFRKSMQAEADRKGVRLTPLIFIMKAVVAALQRFPHFNASLDGEKEALVIKSYYNLGVAVDTPNGLMVPVVRGVDKKGFYELAEELGEISSRAREGSLSRNDLQGGTFTISSLGGIGGTQFTPIVNGPEVAILGVSRSQTKPIWNGSEFKPRLMLPLALSYDHRVIDGADGARFITYLNSLLVDIRRVML